MSQEIAAFRGWLEAIELKGENEDRLRTLLSIAEEFKPGDSDLEDEYTLHSDFIAEMQTPLESLGEGDERNRRELANAIVAYIRNIVFPQIHAHKNTEDPSTFERFSPHEAVFVVPRQKGSTKRNLIKVSSEQKWRRAYLNRWENAVRNGTKPAWTRENRERWNEEWQMPHPFTRYVPTKEEVVRGRVQLHEGGRRATRKLNKRNRARPSRP